MSASKPWLSHEALYGFVYIDIAVKFKDECDPETHLVIKMVSSYLLIQPWPNSCPLNLFSPLCFVSLCLLTDFFHNL